MLFAPVPRRPSPDTSTKINMRGILSISLALSAVFLSACNNDLTKEKLVMKGTPALRRVTSGQGETSRRGVIR
jgi:hypothetical protein